MIWDIHMVAIDILSDVASYCHSKAMVDDCVYFILFYEIIFMIMLTLACLTGYSFKLMNSVTSLY